MSQQSNMKNAGKIRRSGVELLRIFAACAVVMLHYNSGKAFVYVQDGSVNQYVLYFLESLCICAVDLFIFITGYFLCKSQKRSIGKILELYMQIVLFNEAFYLLSVFFGKRNSNLELFRIITMLLIVAHHYVGQSGLNATISYNTSNVLQDLFLLIFGWGGKTGINCFVIITGYFMCTSNITVKKFVKLLLEIQLYRIGFFVIFILTGVIGFSVADLIKILFPVYGMGEAFITSYLPFFLLIPFVNILIKAMSQKQHISLILLLVIIYSVTPTFLITDFNFFNISWFIVVYIIGAYIKLYPNKCFDSKKISGIWALLFLLLSWLSIVVGYILRAKTGVNLVNHFVVDSNKILALFMAVSSFLFFKNINLKNNRLINTIAASTFGVLLISSGSRTMTDWLWKTLLHNTTYYQTNMLYLHAFVSVIGVFSICILIDYLRINLIEKPFFKVWDKYWYKVSDWYRKTEHVICEKLQIKGE